MKKWLTQHFLPLWAKETVLRDNKLLQAENKALRQNLAEQERYIEGIRLGLRGRRNG